MFQKLIQAKNYLLKPEIRQTLCYSMAFFVLGIALAAPGTAFLALVKNTNSSVAEMGYIFVTRSVGYLVGSVVGGPLFDRFNGNRLLSASIIVTGIGNFFVPLATNIWQLAIMYVASGFSMGLLDTGGNVCIIWLWGDKSGPYMQALHFAFGLGAFFAPLFVGAAMTSQDGDPTYAFWTIFFISLPICVWLLTFSVTRREEKEEGGVSEPIGIKEKFVILLTGFFLAVNMGAEVSAGGYIYTFSVLNNVENEINSALLNSTFWGFLSIGGLIAIPLSVYLSAEKSLPLNMIGCLSSTILWVIFPTSRPVVWIVAIFYGLSMSSTFPTAINLAEMYVSLTGKLASVCVVGAALGEMLVPLLVARLFESPGPNSLIWILFASSIGSSLFCAVIIFVGRTGRKYAQTSKNGGTYAVLEMKASEEDDEASVEGASN